MKDLTWQATTLLIFAISCIAALEAYALSKGIDGVLLTGTIGAIAGIPAYVLGRKKSKTDGQQPNTD